MVPFRERDAPPVGATVPHFQNLNLSFTLCAALSGTEEGASGMDAVLTVLFRWLHVIFAAVVIGGVVFMRIILPAGTRHLDAATRDDVFLRCRRIFKMVIHTAILFLLISGVYNTIRLWDQYRGLHGLWGTHVLLGLVIFGISLWLLMGKQAPGGHQTWALVNLVLLLVLVAVASTLKTVRERRNVPATTTTAAQTNLQTP